MARRIVVKFKKNIFQNLYTEEFQKNGEDLFGKFSATKYLDSRRGNPVIPTFRDLFVKFYLCEKFSRKAKLEPPSHRPRFLIKQTGSKITGSRCKSNGGGSLLLRGKIRARMKVEQRSIIFRVSDLMAIDFSQTLSSLVFLVPGKNRYLTT